MITTARLVLRGWHDADREPWAAMNADPEVMQHFPSPLNRAEADALVDRFAGDLSERGWGLWALEHDGAFVGFTGLNPVPDTATGNLRSRAVMERLGMRRDPRDDFEHPRRPEGDRLRPHVLYRLRVSDF